MQWALALLVVISFGGQFARGLADGFAGAARHPEPSPVESALAAVAMLAVIIAIGWRSWRELDEVERYDRLQWFAATGVVAILARPLLIMAQPALHLADIGAVAWFLSLGGGLTVATVLGLSRR